MSIFGRQPEGQKEEEEEEEEGRGRRRRTTTTHLAHAPALVPRRVARLQAELRRAHEVVPLRAREREKEVSAWTSRPRRS